MVVVRCDNDKCIVQCVVIVVICSLLVFTCVLRYIFFVIVYETNFGGFLLQEV